MISLRAIFLFMLFAYTLSLRPSPANQNASTWDNAQDIDRSIKAGNDFYHYANGTWLRTAVIPAGQASYDTRSMLAARTSQRVRDLIQHAAAAQSAKGSVAQKVGDYYASFMDESSIEAKGMTPLADVLVRGASPYDVAKMLGDTIETVEKHYTPFVRELRNRVRMILESGSGLEDVAGRPGHDSDAGVRKPNFNGLGFLGRPAEKVSECN